jgi:hypothetical protein
MSNYRQNSLDPSEPRPEQGPPGRAFNTAQWIGAVLAIIGVAAFAAQFAGRLGWIPRIGNNDAIPFVPLMALGTVLMSSRRQSVCATNPEALRRRRILAIAVLILAAILGAVLVIEFKGA